MKCHNRSEEWEYKVSVCVSSIIGVPEAGASAVRSGLERKRLLPYALAPTVGRDLPLRSMRCWATGAHAQESPTPCRVDRFSLSYTAHLCEERKQSNNTPRACSGPPGDYLRITHATFNPLPREAERVPRNKEFSVCELHRQLMNVPRTY